MNDDELDGLLGIGGARQSAERQLLELVRGEDSDGFTLTITCSDGRWSVVTDDLDAGTRAYGEGASFTEAWHRQDPRWPTSS